MNTTTAQKSVHIDYHAQEREGARYYIADAHAETVNVAERPVNAVMEPIAGL